MIRPTHESDRHIGFGKPANMDVTETLKAAIDKINILQATQHADLTLHTGGISHVSKPTQSRLGIAVAGLAGQLDTVEALRNAAMRRVSIFRAVVFLQLGESSFGYLPGYMQSIRSLAMLQKKAAPVSATGPLAVQLVPQSRLKRPRRIKVGCPR